MGYKGYFLAVEGIDGCGKSTQARMLQDFLDSKGFETRQYQDPGTTAAGLALRELLLHRADVELHGDTQICMFTAARAQLWHTCILPDLEAGRIVIQDRWSASTFAYQAYGNQQLHRRQLILDLNRQLVGLPDVTVILDLDPDAAAKRHAGNDRFEAAGIEYQRRLRAGYLDYLEFDHQSCCLAPREDEDAQAVHRRVRVSIGGGRSCPAPLFNALLSDLC